AALRASSLSLRNLMKHLTRLTLVPALLAVALIAGSGCAKPYSIQRVGTVVPAKRPADRDIPLYATGSPHGGLPVALVQSRQGTRRDDRTLTRQLDDLKQAAREAGADAVIDVQLLPIRRRGWRSDPNTPVPSWRHDDWLE